ncbi:MAG: hypothetical protein JO208_14545 [Alphaproteobacteria bacterium]|nr:hypothetical protein [Alphaproteobacteria bacterium]
MKKIVLGALCCALIGGAAWAGDAAGKRGPRPGAVVLELYYNAKTATITRSYNVANVSSIAQGTYCITPTNPVDPNKIYPAGSAEYLNNGWYPYAGYVSWQDTTVATDCAAGDLEVKTIYGGGPQNAISFSLLVFE